MARWTIKNVTIKGVAMAVPEHVVKTSEPHCEETETAGGESAV